MQAANLVLQKDIGRKRSRVEENPDIEKEVKTSRSLRRSEQQRALKNYIKKFMFVQHPSKHRQNIKFVIQLHKIEYK